MEFEAFVEKEGISATNERYQLLILVLRTIKSPQT
jgi:hypothetical protein